MSGGLKPLISLGSVQYHAKSASGMHKSSHADESKSALSQALPVSGTSDFMAIRARGQLYVDKTGYVERMLASPLDYVFLARPRRFGKSLLLSTLECMYARESDEWFQDLAIGRSGFLDRVPQCPVLKLDVSLASPFNAENIDARLRRVVDARCQQTATNSPVAMNGSTTRFPICTLCSSCWIRRKAPKY